MKEKLCALKEILRYVACLEENLNKEYHITLSEALLLCCIGGGCTGSLSLQEQIGLSLSRISRLLNRLEQKGLIKRIRGTKDKRHWLNEPTEKGREVLAALQKRGIVFPPQLCEICTALKE
ncbi:MAG: MarR family transcriptional regulator [Treponemataceae bacterium]|nr:MarR family transcriptional regulator [Treponemataceae bacterium]